MQRWAMALAAALTVGSGSVAVAASFNSSTQPDGCGSVSGACDAVRDLRVLGNEVLGAYKTRRSLPSDLSELEAWGGRVAPMACSDFSRAPQLDGWRAGCRFNYRLQRSANGAEVTLSALGTAADVDTVELSLRLSQLSTQNPVVEFSALDTSVWRAVDATECRPVSCRQAAVCEGVEYAKSIRERMSNWFSVDGAFEPSLTELGFAPFGCTDGTRASAEPGVPVSCFFHYRLGGDALVTAVGDERTENVTLAVEWSGEVVLLEGKGVDVSACGDTESYRF